MSNSLEIRNLEKKYGMAPSIFKEVNYTFNGGTIVGLSGENGSGKSTFLKLLALLSRPDEGEIFFNSVNIWKEPQKYIRRIGVVSDWISLPMQLNFEELIRWQMESLQSSNDEISEMIISLKERFNFDERSKQMIQTYSSGMKKKTQIAAALSTNPDILILDEPFQALDQSTVKILKDEIISLKNRGIILFLASHIHDINQELFDIELHFPLRE